jgi:ATP-binding cassette subfamily B (MDR/TAP) protein 1
MADQNPNAPIESKGVETITIENDTAATSLQDSKPEKPKRSVLGPYFRIWRYGTTVDHLIRVIGVVAAFTDGGALPLMTLIFGDMVDKFNAWGDGTISPEDFMAAVSKNALYFTYLFIGILFLSFIMNTCFKITARRTIKRLRRDVVRSLVRQDITYFDSCSPGSVATLISNNANLIENGLGERLALAFEGIGQLIVAFIVAFARQATLTAVVATMLPLTIGVIAAAVTAMTKIDVKILKTIGQAGGLAEEALSTMPIITAFGATKQIQTRYNAYLEIAKKLGIKKGPIMGLQMSVQWSIMFCAYGLAWFYGARIVANSDGGISGGHVLT